MKITASAPTKVILTGEHYVVYGAPAITVALDARNIVELYAETGPAEIVVEGTIGQNVWKPGSEIEGMLFKAFLEMAKHIFAERKVDFATFGKKLRLVIHYSDMPKGCGNSASIAAAAALALYKLLDHAPTRDELFHTVQVAEKVAHGAPSGVDARTCATGKPQRFQKAWDDKGNVKFTFQDTRVEFPKGTVLLLVTSNVPTHQADSTVASVGTFAQRKIGKKPADANVADRQKLIAEFTPIFIAFSNALHASGNELELAKAWQANNNLLASGGVIPPEMQERIDWTLAAGALGAKGTGGAGRGGTVIALAYEKDVPHIRNALRKRGLHAMSPALATKGASVDKVE